MTSFNKSYQNEHITVFWKPEKCIHSANCVRGLRAVFDPGRKPWIELSEGETGDIIRTVNNCPSGALSFEYHTPPADQSQTK
jgi:uncharacterized Fe-S cluster protein YjdI